MRAESPWGRIWILGVLCLLLAGCASTGAPAGWLPTAEEGPLDYYGAWISIYLNAENGNGQLVGEFLAVDQDSIFVLGGMAGAADEILVVARGQVQGARIAFFDPQFSQAAGWVAAGSISTLSHGIGLAISLPVWLIAGGASAGAHSQTPLEDYPGQPWEVLRKYARFPQGPPPGIHQLGLRAKPGFAARNDNSPQDWTKNPN